ncbi:MULTISPECIES: nitrite reductase small subunit NirD [Pseudomonadaceae]|jgi:nitrite reductase (NADH) small subunit|uniref:Nitrite reductase small subunit n=1 Tax=Aquipseudomonas alcaligenes TaxID=43263 RepID=A0AA37FQQ4_AQUAC|nr:MULTISPECIES: nitrite reductase small subunit NirD [Pseudomonas]MDC7825652.1 nitrite reductase small subunit NirD [Pseudomonas sp. BLCC-B13]BCR24005.1 nitrite reductase small subunit [Pseudomonas alcaligenes]GIZ69070.1 nitrite reductase small subunit [Pseudomonas alcaligenes]GIZ73391.1 nitrite reductase small subunit [Pseudomonas alcaligenes]GIZ77778.1 nitrite reductase small subunit [Pseudomonas alcaligenes]
MNIALNLKCNWQPLCSTADLVANSGVVALLEGQQVALFYLPESEQQVFAIGNCDPKSGANVIGRGIVGHLQGELVIASPLYKQHYRLRDGGCLEYPELNLPVWPVRLNGEQVEVALS